MNKLSPQSTKWVMADKLSTALQVPDTLKLRLPPQEPVVQLD